MKFRAIQKILVLILVAIFVISTIAVKASGETTFVSVFWSIMNMIGADFPPTQSLIDSRDPLILFADAIGVQGKLVFTILLTTIFYQLLGMINIRDKFNQHTIRNFKKHTIVVPMNDIGIEIVRYFTAHGKQIVGMDSNPRLSARLNREGLHTVSGDPTETYTFKKANIASASSLILVDYADMKNALIALDARKMNKKIFIASRLMHPNDVARMEKAGINRVIMSDIAVGDNIAEYLTQNIKR